MAQGTPESVFVSLNHQIISQHEIKTIFFLLDESCFFTQSHNFSSERFTRRTTWLGLGHLSTSSSVRLWFLIHLRAWDPVFPTRASEDSTSDIIHLHFPPTGLMSHTTIHTCLQGDPQDHQGLTENFDIDTGKVRKIGLLTETMETSHVQPKLLDCACSEHKLLVFTASGYIILSVEELYFFFDGVNEFGLLKRLFY